MRIGALVFFLIIGLFGYAQRPFTRAGRSSEQSTGRRSIVDDSTKQVYGPETVEFTTEYLIKNNFVHLYENPDTTVYQREKYDRVDDADRRFQSLGFLGSPLFDLEFDLGRHPGRISGIQGYDHYFRRADQLKYYDTKSPFMNMWATLGGDNRTKIDFAYSRNVNPHWNIGFDMNRITADKQIGLEQTGDRQTESVGFDFYTYYNNEEKPFQIGFSFISLNHQIADIGGVYVADDFTIPDLYLYQDAETWLQDAQSVDKRSRFHIYVQYDLVSGLETYFETDYSNQRYSFSNTSSSTGSTRFEDFFPGMALINDTLINEYTEYSDWTNEAGIKGTIKGAFYRLYVKHRSLVYSPKYLIETSLGETYGGAYLRFDWKNKFSVVGRGEISNEGAYHLEGKISSKISEVVYTSQLALPSFLVQNYSGNFHNWVNRFNLTFSNKINGKLNLKWKIFEFEPEVSLMTRSNMIVMNVDDQTPIQLPKTILINRYGGKISMNLLRGIDFLGMNENEYIRLENRGVFQSDFGEGDKYLRFPAFRYSGRFFWRGEWFQNAVPIEFGVDVNYRSAFYGNSYSPVFSRFYVQNDFRLDAYTTIDFFINMKIGNLRAYLKWVHLNQQPNDGYMVTPFFPGQQRVFDFGVQWLFIRLNGYK